MRGEGHCCIEWFTKKILHDFRTNCMENGDTSIRVGAEKKKRANSVCKRPEKTCFQQFFLRGPATHRIYNYSRYFFEAN
jgi:hypothetical protein